MAESGPQIVRNLLQGFNAVSEVANCTTQPKTLLGQP